MRKFTITETYYISPKTGEETPVICATCAIWNKEIHGRILCTEGKTYFLGKPIDEPMSKDKWSCKSCYIPDYYNIKELFPFGRKDSYIILNVVKMVSNHVRYFAKAKQRVLKWLDRYGFKLEENELEYAFRLFSSIYPQDYKFLYNSLTPIITFIIKGKIRNALKVKPGDEVEWVMNKKLVRGLVKKVDRKMHRIKLYIIGEDIKLVDPEYYERAKKLEPDRTPRKEVEYDFNMWGRYTPQVIK